MIHGNVPMFELEDILSNLRHLPMTFYLTGSRAFGTEHEQSDWDFFTADDPDTEELLIKMGFKILIQDDAVAYKDEITNKVLRHAFGVDVQLVEDYALKLRVQNVLTVFWNRNNYPREKIRQRHHWNSLYRQLKDLPM